MNNDLDVIIKKFPHRLKELHIYAIGDVHVGAPNFDEKAIRKKLQIIKDDPCACLCICGDLGDYGLKNSKTNVYQATMQPKEQQEYLYELFRPVASKMTAAVPGNHEERITKEVGTCPLYDLCVLWGVPEVYRENTAITAYYFGSPNNTTKQVVFYGITSHGSSRNKHKKYINCFEGADFAISGHTHLAEYSPHGRIRIDRISGNATHVPYKEIIVDANLSVGGYGMKKEFEIPPPPELQYLQLTWERETGKQRTVRRVMNYHSIQL